MLRVGDRTITFVPHDGGHRIEVDGRPVPMLHSVTESRETNSGRYKDVLVQPRLVSAVPLAMLAEGRSQASVSRSSERPAWCVYATAVTGRAEVYNTAIYELQSISLQFPDDFSEVSVVTNTHTDLSD
jgi:hypothetical protein